MVFIHFRNKSLLVISHGSLKYSFTVAPGSIKNVLNKLDCLNLRIAVGHNLVPGQKVEEQEG